MTCCVQNSHKKRYCKYCVYVYSTFRRHGHCMCSCVVQTQLNTRCYGTTRAGQQGEFPRCVDRMGCVCQLHSVYLVHKQQISGLCRSLHTLASHLHLRSPVGRLSAVESSWHCSTTRTRSSRCGDGLWMRWTRRVGAVLS